MPFCLFFVTNAASLLPLASHHTFRFCPLIFLVFSIGTDRQNFPHADEKFHLLSEFLLPK